MPKMKNLAVTLLVLCCTLPLHAQLQKGTVLISAEGNYQKSLNDNGPTTNHTQSKAKNLNLGVSLGLALRDNFVVGVGLGYYRSVEDRSSQVFMGETISAELMELTTSSLMPSVFAGYYAPIMDRLYLSTNLKLAYGNISSEYSTFMAFQSISWSSSSEFRTAENSNSSDLFVTTLYPELTYFITPKLGLSLGLGGIAYSIPDWETDSASFLVNFNPAYWSFGLKLAL